MKNSLIYKISKQIKLKLSIEINTVFGSNINAKLKNNN